MRKPAPKSGEKSGERAVVDDDVIPGIPDTFENVVKALVKPQPKKPNEWNFMRESNAKRQVPRHQKSASSENHGSG